MRSCKEKNNLKTNFSKAVLNVPYFICSYTNLCTRNGKYRMCQINLTQIKLILVFFHDEHCFYSFYCLPTFESYVKNASILFTEFDLDSGQHHTKVS